MSTFPGDGEQRRQHDRQESSLQTILIAEETNFHCRLVNISVSGARIHSSRRFRAGDRLQLAIQPFGIFPCEIVWQKELECGIKFLVSAEQVAPVLAAMAVYG